MGDILLCGPAGKAKHAQSARVRSRQHLGPVQVATGALLTELAVLRTDERRLLRRKRGSSERAVILLEGQEFAHLLADKIR